MRGAGTDLQGRAVDELRGPQGGVGKRHDLVVVAVDDQSGYVDLFEILGEVSLGEGFDAVERCVEAALHSLKPE